MKPLIVDGCPVEISISHVTEPVEGWSGTTLIAVCHSLEEVNKVLNDPSKQPEPYWQWKIDFQDALE